ncbi:hypothetical protein ACSQ67_010871 [Phaseolus vulgaris]
MGCFRCTGKSSKKSNNVNRTQKNIVAVSKIDLNVNGKSEDNHRKPDQLSMDAKNLNLKEISDEGKVKSYRAQTFTFDELATATGNFMSDCFLGEGGFGKVYKGFIEKINQVVAIKQLDLYGHQGIREFVVEVLTLSLADHPNLVTLIGFCAEGEERLLVYEYMPLGSLENHLQDYAMTGQLTFKSDIYSFGVVLLEIITGRKAIDHMKPPKEQNLVAWARPLFKNRRRFSEMVDPLLEGHYPVRGLYQVLAIAAMCVQEQPSMRPVIADVVTALNYLESQKYDPQLHSVQSSGFSSRARTNDHRLTVSYGSDPRVRKVDHKLLGSSGNSSGSETESYIEVLSSPRLRSDGHKHFYSNDSS